jgi:hypothetical protein
MFRSQLLPEGKTSSRQMSCNELNLDIPNLLRLQEAREQEEAARMRQRTVVSPTCLKSDF